MNRWIGIALIGAAETPSDLLPGGIAMDALEQSYAQAKQEFGKG